MVFLSVPEPADSSPMGSLPVSSTRFSSSGWVRAKSSTRRQAAKVRSCRGQLSATSEKVRPNWASFSENSWISRRLAVRTA